MQKKISGIFKSTTISRTFECTTNIRTAEVQAHSVEALIASIIQGRRCILSNEVIYKCF